MAQLRKCKILFTTIISISIIVTVIYRVWQATGDRGDVEYRAEESVPHDPVGAWNYLKQHTKDADSVFFNFNPTHELQTSINGSYFDPLSGYKNPCWIASINESSVYGSHQRGSVRDSWAKMQQVFSYRIANGDYWRIRCFPYAMLIGMSKSGTTNLYSHISDHPEVFPASTKETTFWGRYRTGNRQAIYHQSANLTFFMDFFDEAAESIRLLKERNESGVYHPGITMDGTPHYMWDFGYWSSVPANIGEDEPKIILPHTLYALAPELKLIVILRNPADRFYSKFRMMNPGENPEIFHKDVEIAVEMWGDCRKEKSERACTYTCMHEQESRYQAQHSMSKIYEKIRKVDRIGAGMYHIHMEDWLKVFPKSQIFLVRAEDYFYDSGVVLKKVFKFLGVRDLSKAEIDVITYEESERETSEPMLPETRKLLDEIYEPVEHKLPEVLAKYDLSWA